ncbi:nitroreductase family protein [Paenibacillus sp. J22TS3]|uniref:nitroreductase family protein n=1 Tax=Paenibacillus sp. J22TS3 TaxID=2807192 RepID=UPI001B149221|nr:nitroreductase family protein [Paenibacillus sp. J22TS3]GIP23240.1 putative NAD(P)H nitroreductase MhqN [Paenibacillus sp. J22TS3]
MEFNQVVNERRSAVKFIPDTIIPRDELEEMFKSVKLAPSAFNLQHAAYVVVDDPDLKEQLYEAANKQYKIKTASAVIVVLGDMDAYKNVAQINEGFLNLGFMNKQEYDMTVESVTQFYLERGETFMREEAIRNASLSAMLFMLIAKDRGWDTCPMIGYDPAKIGEIINLPDRMVPAMLIAIGKEDTSKIRPRGYRKPTGEFVVYNGF